MERMIIVGIAGGTGSGKTTITRAIQQRLGEDVALISHDSYYRAHHDLPFEVRMRLNYDHPDAYETELLVEHLAQLRKGMAIEVPVYDFATHDRVEQTCVVQPARIVLVEGILLLASAELRELMDIKVFVEADADERLLRRLERDMRERGRSLQSVMDQYRDTVKPMHEAFVEPSKQYADLIIPTNKVNAVGARILVSYLCTCV